MSGGRFEIIRGLSGGGGGARKRRSSLSKNRSERRRILASCCVSGATSRSIGQAPTLTPSIMRAARSSSTPSLARLGAPAHHPRPWP